MSKINVPPIDLINDFVAMSLPKFFQQPSERDLWALPNNVDDDLLQGILLFRPFRLTGPAGK